MYGCRIELQHEQAQAFFDDAAHPDIEELRRRDSFLEQLAQESNFQMRGLNATAEIPDINFDMLFSAEDAYIPIVDLPCTLTLGTTVNIQNRDTAYLIRPIIDIAA